MEQVITGFFSVEILIYCIVVYLAVLGFRRGVEWLAKKVAYIVPDKYEGWPNYWWREIILPATPVVFGVGLALLFPAYPFPASFAASKAGLAAVGFICGICNSYVYSYAKSAIKKLVEIKAEPKE